MPYAVVVTFSIKPEAFDAFMLLMLENARKSLDHEPGCHQFDVATDTDRPQEVFLYEIYADREAFDAHLGSTHFQAFDTATESMIATKEVRTYAKVSR